MARPLRVDYAGAWQHVMNRGAGRRKIFHSQTQRDGFYELLARITEIYGIEIHAFCLMSNHYHLLVRTPEVGLPKAMRHLNSSYAQIVNRDLGTDGPLFRGRYASKLVDAEAYLLQVSRYIHLNPVEEELVSRAEDYPHSSYRAYLDPDEAPPWLVTSDILDRFGSTGARERYREFVEQGIDDETRIFYLEASGDPVLGGESFRHRIGVRVERRELSTDREIPGARRVRPRPDLSEIAEAVCAAFEVSMDELRRASPNVRACAQARGAFAYLGRFEAGCDLVTIGRWLGLRSYTGVSSALARFRMSSKTDSSLWGTLEAARRLLRCNEP